MAAARGRKLLKIRRRAEFKHSKLGLRKGDKVQVLAGDDKGKVGNVLDVLTSRERVIVEGVNMIFRHVKKSQQNPQGGRIEREAPIHVSNVALYDEKAGRGTRTRSGLVDGRKVRVSVRTEANLDA